MTVLILVVVEWILGLDAMKVTWRLQAHVGRITNILLIAQLLTFLNRHLVLHLGELPLASSTFTSSLCIALAVK